MGHQSALPPERPVIDRLACMGGTNPLAEIQIRNRPGDGDDAGAGIGVDAKLDTGALEQVRRILVQSQVGVARTCGRSGPSFRPAVVPGRPLSSRCGGWTTSTVMSATGHAARHRSILAHEQLQARIGLP